jgi:hypothetical protein
LLKCMTYEKRARPGLTSKVISRRASAHKPGMDNGHQTTLVSGVARTPRNPSPPAARSPPLSALVFRSGRHYSPVPLQRLLSLSRIEPSSGHRWETTSTQAHAMFDAHRIPERLSVVSVGGVLTIPRWLRSVGEVSLGWCGTCTKGARSSVKCKENFLARLGPQVREGARASINARQRGGPHSPQPQPTRRTLSTALRTRFPVWPTL